MAKIKVGVVGVGHLGSAHAKVYSKLKIADFACVCDCNFERAKEIGKKYKADYYADYEELFGKVDAASIAVPTSLHYNIAKEFLKNNIHVLIEKPVTKTLSEADELIDLAAKRNLVIQVGHIERFNSAIRAIEPYLDKPRFVESQRLGKFHKRVGDVGVVLDLMIHDIDIVLGLIDADVENIEAVGVSSVSDYEDMANVRLNFTNGVIADITASRMTNDALRKIRIFQKDSYISLDFLHQEATFYKKVDHKLIEKKIKVRKEEPLKKELESFLECVKTNTRPVVSGIEGRKALQVALSIISKISPLNAKRDA
jgi:predicted dehydrogenase